MQRSGFHKQLYFLVLILGLLSCESDKFANCTEHETTPCVDDPNMANLRITNTSKYDYCNVLVELNDDRVNYGNLASGESTCHVAFNVLYTYAYVELYIDGRKFIIQPFDFIGETPLAPGYYSYKIDVPEDDGNQYDVNLDFE